MKSLILIALIAMQVPTVSKVFADVSDSALNPKALDSTEEAKVREEALATYHKDDNESGREPTSIRNSDYAEKLKREKYNFKKYERMSSETRESSR